MIDFILSPFGAWMLALPFVLIIGFVLPSD